VAEQLGKAEINALAELMQQRGLPQSAVDDFRRRARSGRIGGGLSQGTLGNVKPIDQARYPKGYTPERKRMVEQLVGDLDVTASPNNNPWVPKDTLGTILRRSTPPEPVGEITDAMQEQFQRRIANASEAATRSRMTDMLARSELTDPGLERLLGTYTDPATGQTYLPPSIDVKGHRTSASGVHNVHSIYTNKGEPPVMVGDISMTATPAGGSVGPRVSEQILAHELGHENSLRQGPGGTRQEWERMGQSILSPGNVEREIGPLAEVMGQEEGAADSFRLQNLRRLREPGTAVARPSPDLARIDAYNPDAYFGPTGYHTETLGLTPYESADAARIFRDQWGETIARNHPNVVTERLAGEAFPHPQEPGSAFSGVLDARANQAMAIPHQNKMILQIGNSEVPNPTFLERMKMVQTQGLEGPIPRGEGGFVSPKMLGEGAAGLLVPIAANAVANKFAPNTETGETLRNAGLGFGLGSAGGLKTAAIGAGLAALGTYLKNQLQH